MVTALIYISLYAHHESISTKEGQIMLERAKKLHLLMKQKGAGDLEKLTLFLIVCDHIS
jgi:hypothetical protein